MDHKLVMKLGQAVGAVTMAKVIMEQHPGYAYLADVRARLVDHLESAERYMMEVADMLEIRTPEETELSPSEKERL